MNPHPPPLTFVELTAEDIDRLHLGLGGSIEWALSELDVEIQRVLGLPWTDLEIGLHTENDGRARNHGAVQQAMLNLGV